MRFLVQIFTRCIIGLACCPAIQAGEPAADETASNSHATIQAYLARRVREINLAEPANAATLDEWQRRRGELREQLFDMLGLWPLPARADLKAEVTGTLESEGIVVEKLHFQSLPGLYVTGSFYRPRENRSRLPAILYLAGHAKAVEDGVSLGNKVSYHHHACWFARHGYACLMIDTLQLGEIEGLHHGTYREGMWWWIARGYTPAGVEAWNGIRALDYLATRDDVDPARIGVTGRSGGGAYTWYVAALDDRAACVVPVAGITDLKDHVVHQCIKGHCDCMYMINEYQWDFGTLAALVAPRPCLLTNTDKDGIFPLAGVVRVHEKMRHVYELYGATDRLGLFISEGPHSDTQELQLAAFRWMNRWLRDTTDPVDDVATKLFELKTLRSLDAIPADERNTRIYEEFVPLADLGRPPANRSQWDQMREQLLDQLQRRSFAAWPDHPPPLAAHVVAEDVIGDLRLRILEFNSEEEISLNAWVLSNTADAQADHITLMVADDVTWDEHIGDLLPMGEIAESPSTPLGQHEVFVVVAPRGWGPNRWPAKELTHLLRSFVLVGTTADAGRIWDVRRAIQAIRGQISPQAPLTISGSGRAAGVALYAAIFEPSVTDARLSALPSSHREGPSLIKVLQTLDVPQAVGLMFPRPVYLTDVEAADWSWTSELARRYEGSSPLQIESK